MEVNLLLWGHALGVFLSIRHILSLPKAVVKGEGGASGIMPCTKLPESVKSGVLPTHRAICAVLCTRGSALTVRGRVLPEPGPVPQLRTERLKG